MKRHMLTRVFHFTSMVAIVFAMTFLPMMAQKVGAVSLNSTPADVGYVDHAYGTGVKAEPTADGAESKLWFNDGIWWGVLFNPDATTPRYEIFRLDWASQTWISTGTAVDSRNDPVNNPVGQADTRADVLWDGGKLYIATHIKYNNSAQTTNDDYWAYLTRYSYNAVAKSYTEDTTTLPVMINEDRTEILVMDKDSTGRLWIAYTSRETGVPTSHVYVKYSAANDYTDWSAAAIDLTDVNAGAATVVYGDAASLIAYEVGGVGKVGVLWSNQSTDATYGGKFYYAEHTATASPLSDWTITPIDIAGLTANDHLKMVASADGQVFSAIKTMNDSITEPTLPGIGVLARSTSGVFDFYPYSAASSNDTRPTLALNETDNTLHLFVTSNEAGGSICHASAPISAINFTPAGPCSEILSSNHFIKDADYPNINNATTTKRNFSNGTGLVVLASDQTMATYLHNVIAPVGPGVTVPTVTASTPAAGSTVTGNVITVTATFNEPMDAATINTTNFMVTGPAGLTGTVVYDAATQTATFSSTSALPVGVHTITVDLTTGIKDAEGTSLAALSWTFEQEVTELIDLLPYKLNLSLISR